MERFTVTNATWVDVPVLRLDDTAEGSVALLAPSLGGNLFSLEVGGHEVLRRPPDPESLKEYAARWGIPVLMPPNRIAGGRFHFNGRDYQLDVNSGPNHIHGFALRRAWDVGAVSTEGGASVTLVFRASKHADVLAQFPHAFVLTLKYTLVGRTLRCESFIQNDGADLMPFGLGFHPYFDAPADDGGVYEIRMPDMGQQWEAIENIPTGRFLQPQGHLNLSSWQRLHGARWNTGYIVRREEADRWSSFELAERVSGRVVRISASPAFGHWVIFNGAPGFEGFVSPEPYTCMTDAFNLNLPRAVSGMDVVAGGEARPAGQFEIAVS